MLKRSRTAWDVLQAMPAFKSQRKIFDAMDAVCQNGVNADEMPNGQGRFGYDPSNPIPTRTIFGSVAYLARLQDQAGQKLEYIRLGSVSPENIDYPVDLYSIKGINIEFHLYLSPYQARNSAKAPAGLRLAEPPPQPPPFKRKSEKRLLSWLPWLAAGVTALVLWWALIFGYFWIVDPRASRRYDFQDRLFKLAFGLPGLVAFMAIVMRIGLGAVRRANRR